MIAFTGFVVARRLVVVRFAPASTRPVVLWFRRDILIKHAIGVFLAVFVYALVALRLEGGRRFLPDLHGDRGPLCSWSGLVSSSLRCCSA